MNQSMILSFNPASRYKFVIVGFWHLSDIDNKLFMNQAGPSQAPIAIECKIYVTIVTFKRSLIIDDKATKKNCYVALSRPTVKCEKTGSFFFFMSDLGEEFAKICIQWPKKALV